MDPTVRRIRAADALAGGGRVAAGAGRRFARRAAGAERAVLRRSALACGPAALLGGILSLSDTGAPLIFGCRSLAVEIRTSFAALFDYDLAGRQSLPVAIFTVMANSSEGPVASLCLLDLLCVFGLLAIASQLGRLGRRSAA